MRKYEDILKLVALILSIGLFITAVILARLDTNRKEAVEKIYHKRCDAILEKND